MIDLHTMIKQKAFSEMHKLNTRREEEESISK